MRRVLTTCPYCGVGCNFYLVVGDDGRLVGVEPSTEHPVSRGQLCVKGWNAFQFVQHPERLTAPQIRQRGRLREAGWDEALDLVAEKLRVIRDKHGPEAIAFFSSAKTTNEENYLMMKLARGVFNTNNIDHCARLCHSATVVGLAATFGSGAMTNSISCMEESDCILVIGSNTTEQHPLIGTRIITAAGNGAKLIVADSRKIRLARLADMHLRLRNGTDVALLNAMMQVIIREGLEDKEFVAERTEDYQELKQVVAHYPPERAASIVGLRAEEVAAAARMFATAERGMIVYSMGITQHTHGVDNVKSCANLAMLTGNLGRPGTGVNPLRGQNNVQGACDMGALPNVYPGYQPVVDAGVRRKFETAWGVEGLPAGRGLTSTGAINAAAQGRLKALYIVGENPMLSHPDQNHVRAALEALEFLVVQDIFATPTTDLADVVLPGACYAEKEGTFTSTERRVQRVRKALEPVGRSRADWEILAALGGRMGYRGMAYRTPGEVMDEIAALTPSYGGVSYGRLQGAGLQWPCPTPKHPGTPILHLDKFARGLGRFEPAEYRPPVELPDQEYPFLLSTGRSYFQYHTGTMSRRSRLLHREERFPYVEINPEDARNLGVRDREWVDVSTRRGEVRAQARVSEVVSKGMLFMTFHFAEEPANLLTSNVLDPEAEIPEFKVCAARVKRER